MNNIFTKEYSEWVKQANLDPLTNNQVKFAEFLLSNKSEVGRVGDMQTIFESVRKYLRNG